MVKKCSWPYNRMGREHGNTKHIQGFTYTKELNVFWTEAQPCLYLQSRRMLCPSYSHDTAVEVSIQDAGNPASALPQSKSERLDGFF